MSEQTWSAAAIAVASLCWLAVIVASGLAWLKRRRDR